MNYQETIEFLFSQLPMYQREGAAAYKADLSNTLYLDDFLGNPHHKFKTIHVAGTNGKGSVSHMLASVLQQQGYKTGLYTSPHLKDFRERIRINGKMIDEDFVVNFTQRIKENIYDIKPSFFEITVAMAFDYFAKQNIDIAVIETGMGGRLDSTNIIYPLVSVITNIGLDHTAFLGDNLSSIAREKAGIIKAGIPLVVGEHNKETDEVFVQKAEEEGAKVLFAQDYYYAEYSLQSVHGTQLFNVKSGDEIAFQQIELDLLGKYQAKNLVTCLKTIDVLKSEGLELADKSIYSGLRQIQKTGLMGRWQILGNNPLIVCDTAHNVEGLTVVLEQIQQIAYKQLHVVIGMVNDKNIEKILEIFPINANYYFSRANIPRALPVDQLKMMALKYNLTGEKYTSVKEALEAAKSTAKAQDMIFVGGSTFVVAEVV
ncbi:MAG: dihydrofolate synthase [Marinilabiliales bacterium]|nr:MAG: dihydrofolate synthase [Marinilabiliales bacterium]